MQNRIIRQQITFNVIRLLNKYCFAAVLFLKKLTTNSNYESCLRSLHMVGIFVAVSGTTACA